MTPDPAFLNKPKKFWAYVRSISQEVGYTVRGEGQIKTPTIEEMAEAVAALGMDPKRLITSTRSWPAISVHTLRDAQVS